MVDEVAEHEYMGLEPSGSCRPLVPFSVIKKALEAA